MRSLPSTLWRVSRLPSLLVAVLSVGLVMPVPAYADATERPSPAPSAEQQASEGDGIGYDISFPQCGRRFPDDPAFTIIGVNGGRVFTVNPCLGAESGRSQLAWAGPDTDFYVNTGNPGPELTKAWPVGQRVPRFCDPANPDSVECAYDYGWNGAAHSYRAAVRAYISLGWAPRHALRTPVANYWWLDVESGNSWREDRELNVAALQGAIDFLETRDVAGIGIYSMGWMWEEIVGTTDAFAEYPNWVAGSTTIRGARRTCIGPGFSGGVVVFTQYRHDGFDANYRC